MLLSWLAERGDGDKFAVAASVVQALDANHAVAAYRTRDLGGALGTKAFTARVVDGIAAA
jgi:3-isopropylmalate dehydrogenase